MNDFWCFFCGDSIELVERKAECGGCGCRYVFSFVDGCIRGIRVESCGAECSCVIYSKGGT